MANGYKAMAELPLTHKAEVNAQDNNGSPPLHQAAAAAGRYRDLSRNDAGAWGRRQCR